VIAQVKQYGQGRYYTKPHPWTDDELDRLKELLAIAPRNIVPAMHHREYPSRSIAAINGRIKKIRNQCQLADIELSDYYTPMKIAKLVGRNQESIEKWFRKGWLRRIAAGGREYYTTPEALAKLMRKRPELFLEMPPDWWEYITDQPKPKFWTLPQLSKALYCHPTAIQVWARKGLIIPASSKRSTLTVFTESELIRFANSNPPITASLLDALKALLKI
jgi:hypothetical protein